MKNGEHLLIPRASVACGQWTLSRLIESRRRRVPRAAGARNLSGGAASEMSDDPARPLRHDFRHEALLYAGEQQFALHTLAFIREGLAREEPVLVVVDEPKIALLAAALGTDARRVTFADMRQVGANPGRLIPAWREFVADHPPGRELRGIGEPISRRRGAAELAECERHEALLNLAFAADHGFRLLCPYDTAALDPAVVEVARRNHPHLIEHGRESASASYAGTAALSEPLGDPLPEPRVPVRTLRFDADSLSRVRRLVRQAGAKAQLPAQRAEDFALAVHEIAANSVRHGGGGGALRVWQQPESLICEVNDSGRLADPLAGRIRPQGVAGYGLWLAQQLSDLVQLRCADSGNVIRLHMRRPDAASDAVGCAERRCRTTPAVSSPCGPRAN